MPGQSGLRGAAGPADPDLTVFGQRQAEAMAKWVADEHFDALYVSPMARARQTAAPLERALAMEATVVPGVKEFDAEENHYIPIEDVRADKETWKRYLTNELQRDMSIFSEVVVASIEQVIADNRGRRVGIVCHGGVINIWAAAVMGLKPTMFFSPDYTSVNRFAAASTGERSVVSLNEVAHLRGVS